MHGIIMLDKTGQSDKFYTAFVGFWGFFFHIETIDWGQRKTPKQNGDYWERGKEWEHTRR